MGQPTTDQYPRIDIRTYQKQVGFRLDIIVTCSADQQGVLIKTQARSRFMLKIDLWHWAHRRTYAVDVVWVPCHFGGERPWIVCPGCQKQVAKLYGGRFLGCRQCHCLHYESQQCDKLLMPLLRSNRLRERLGCFQTWFHVPANMIPRPKGMHRKTYDALIEELEDWDRRAEAVFEYAVGRM